MLLLKCLGEILPGIGLGAMPVVATGYYTLVDQALDIGLLVPFGALSGVLLLKRRSLGYRLFASPLILFLCIWLSVITGEAMLRPPIGRMNVAGIAACSIFLAAALWLLVTVLARIRSTTLVVT